MLKKYIVLALILLTVGATNGGTAFAAAQNKNQDSAAERIKISVAEIGVGEKARVKITLRDNAKLTGYISEARDAEFTVTEKNTKNVVAVPYADVAKIKKDKFSAAAKIGIGVGIGAVIYVVVIAVITKGGTRRILD